MCSDEAVFCTVCGTQLEAPAAPQAQPQTSAPQQPQTAAPQQSQQTVEPTPTDTYTYKDPYAADASEDEGSKPKINVKLIGAAAAGVVVLLLAVLLIASLAGGGSSGSDWSTITAWSADGETYFVYNGTVLDYKAEAAVEDIHRTADMKLYYSSTTDEAFVVSSKGVECAEDTHLSEATYFSFAADGGVMIYATYESELYIFDMSDCKETLIAELEDECTALAVSPDGKTVVYADGDESYIYTKGSVSELEISSTKAPIAVSNSAKYIYCYDSSSDAIYLSDKKGNTEKIKSDVSSVCYFNSDNTEMIFYTDDATYYYKAGGEAEKLYSSYVMPAWLYANGTYSSMSFSTGDGAVSYSEAQLWMTGYSSYFYAYGMELDSFVEIFYYDWSNNIIYFDKNHETDRVATSIDSYDTSSDGKVLMYTKYDTLYRVTTSDYEEPEAIAEDVEEFEILPDGSGAYYIDEDDTLMYAKKNGKTTKIADDAASLYVTSDGYALFLVDYANSVGTLYSSKNGGSKNKIADDVSSVICGYGASLYVTNDSNTYNVYAAKSGVSFKLIIEDCDYLLG